MKRLVSFVLFITAILLIYTNAHLPKIGALNSPAATHVSPRYIERSHEETGAPNFVTGILADYRGYDTLGETAVIFTAGLACLLILGIGLERSR